MPILRLNAGPDGVSLHGSPAPAIPALRRASKGTGPILILIHGFKYDPDCDSCSPHSRIFGLTRHPDSTHTQWLRPLGFGCGDRHEGLAIAFGWRARGNLWRAQRSARAAGVQLARAIAELRHVAPHRPVHAITHSMGSEVIFEALHHLPAGSIDRIVAMTGASFASVAQTALDTPAGRAAELLNVTSRENDLFDALFEGMMTADVTGDRAMGAGLNLPNVANIQLDCPRTLATLPRFGGHIQPPQRRICHWSGYTRPGALRFYARALRRPQDVPIEALQDALPDAPAARWSRILALPQLPLRLPMEQKTAS